jgi:hypothetical protein
MQRTLVSHQLLVSQDKSVLARRVAMLRPERVQVSPKYSDEQEKGDDAQLLTTDQRPIHALSVRSARSCAAVARQPRGHALALANRYLFTRGRVCASVCACVRVRSVRCVKFAILRNTSGELKGTTNGGPVGSLQVAARLLRQEVVRELLWLCDGK